MFPDRQDLLDRGVVFREWEEKVEGVNPMALSWEAFLESWDLVETDFQAFYGVDLASSEYQDRSWRWLRVRLVRLLGEDTALGRKVRDAA